MVGFYYFLSFSLTQSVYVTVGREERDRETKKNRTNDKRLVRVRFNLFTSYSNDFDYNKLSYCVGFWFFNESAEKNNRNNRTGTTNYYDIPEKNIPQEREESFLLTRLTRVARLRNKVSPVLRHGLLKRI